jgi:ParB/RepB/Spo0J family partition protein
MSEDKLILVPVDKILPPYLLLRMLDRRSLAYIELRDSIKEIGLINSICVRPSAKHKGHWELIDGMYRWQCHKDLSIPIIPAIVKTATDTDVLRLQVMANAIRAKTQPIEYANQMKRLFMADTKLTFAKLSFDLKKSPAWIKSMLGLLNLCPDASVKADRGEIPISSAYMLAKLPKWLQMDLIDDAVIMSAKEFCRMCQDRLMVSRNINRDSRQQNFYRTQFQPHPYLQHFQVLVAESKHLAVGPTLLVKHDIKKPIDAWKLAIDWALHLDPDNIMEQEQRAKERFDKQQELIQKRSQDRNAKKDAEFIERMPSTE